MTLDAARFMHDPSRGQRRQSADERGLLIQFLEFQRDTLLWKVDGLTRAQLTASHTPSGMSLLGLIKHMAYVERNWFQIRFLGRPLSVPWRAGDPGGDFRIEQDEAPDAILAFYVREVEESRRIVEDSPSIDALAVNGEAQHSLRWILLHMIEETARHCGHADFMREFTDGTTGE